MDKKKLLAYGFLVTCIGVVVYLGYDTYRISTLDPADVVDEQDNESDSQGGSDVEVLYKEYGIDKDVDSLLLEKGESVSKLYLYDNNVICFNEDEIEGGLVDKFDASNENLLGVVSFPTAVFDTESKEVAATSVSVFKRNIEGGFTEVSAVPASSDTLKIEAVDDGYNGELNLVWDDNRSVVGEFEAVECGK